MVKNRKILTYILIVLIVIVSVMGIIFAVNSKQEMSGWKEPEDSIKLTPNNEADRQSYEDGEVKLNFQEKQQLTKSTIPGKFGFRRELIIEKPTAFMQHMPVDSNMENIRFGIYKDKTLEEPIEEADAGYNFNASWHMEEGAELSEYPEYKTNIQVILQPGIYYAAVYTTDKSDEGVFLYSSWYDVLDSDLTLEAEKYQYFYAEPGKEYEFPFTVDDNSEIVLETAGIAGTLKLYDTDGKTVLETLEIEANQPYKASKKHFSFEKGGSYCFRLTDYPQELYEKIPSSGMSVLNQNWLRYKVTK